MKTENTILIAFILNVTFSILEFVGGIFIGSVAILSDAVHDLGDAVSIGISCWLEKISRKPADDRYTYGYARYSVLGSVITTMILLLGSVAVLCNAINRIIHPSEIEYDGMILLAVFGVCVNFVAAFFTREGDSLNQKAVNLHMFEDVLGWGVVLVGAIVMKWTDFTLVDPLMSIGVAVLIIGNAVRHLKDAIDVFLEKTPHDIHVKEIQEHITRIDGVLDVHHIHIWSMDGRNHYATMHIVSNGNFREVKEKVRKEVYEHGIIHVTLETEAEDEQCRDKQCRSEIKTDIVSHHHHHHI